MKMSLLFFVFSLFALTILIAINQWDIPVMIWLTLIFSLVALVSGVVCLEGIFG